MVCNTTVEEIFKIIGHDGSEILWPELPEPIKRKSFHIEELQYVALKFNTVLADFWPGIGYIPNGTSVEPQVIDLFPQLQEVLKVYNGILLGKYVGRGRHAVAWNAKEGMIYDPAGRLVKPGEASFEIDSFHAAITRRV
jgi:hypothetical protein